MFVYLFAWVPLEININLVFKHCVLSNKLVGLKSIQGFVYVTEKNRFLEI